MLSPVKVTLHVEKASGEYLKQLKLDVNATNNTAFGVKQLMENIGKDDFVRRAVFAHEAALTYKLQRYTTLSKLTWSTAGNDPQGTGISVKMDDVIKKMLGNITNQLHTVKSESMEAKMKRKRRELLTILNDPLNGINSIKGTSREGVRSALVKIIYMFLKVPQFFFKGFINFMVTGPAGSGKTKVSGVIGHVFKNLGILATDKVLMATVSGAKRSQNPEHVGIRS